MIIGEKIKIRLAKPSDLQEILEILSDAAAIIKAKGIVGQWTAPFMAEPMLDSISRGDVHIGFIGRASVGTFALQWEDELWWEEER